VLDLNVYTCREMPPDAWMTWPMTNLEYAAVMIIWLKCWPYLPIHSRRHGPTAIQYCAYQRVLQKQMGKLGCKFRRNSDRNSRIPFRFGDFAPGTTELLYVLSGFLRCFAIMSLKRTGRFARPPHCEACLGPSERAYLSLFELRDSRRGCFRGSYP
jgi:hypothetical protein